MTIKSTRTLPAPLPLAATTAGINSPLALPAAPELPAVRSEWDYNAEFPYALPRSAGFFSQNSVNLLGDWDPAKFGLLPNARLMERQTPSPWVGACATALSENALSRLRQRAAELLASAHLGGSFIFGWEHALGDSLMGRLHQGVSRVIGGQACAGLLPLRECLSQSPSGLLDTMSVMTLSQGFASSFRDYRNRDLLGFHLTSTSAENYSSLFNAQGRAYLARLRQSGLRVHRPVHYVRNPFFVSGCKVFLPEDWAGVPPGLTPQGFGSNLPPLDPPLRRFGEIIRARRIPILAQEASAQSWPNTSVTFGEDRFRGQDFSAWMAARGFRILRSEGSQAVTVTLDARYLTPRQVADKWGALARKI